MSLFPGSVNAFGATMFAGFFLCWVGGVISFFIMQRAGDARYFDGGLGVWKVPEARARFLRFFLFCLAGIICGLAGFAFGGWPTGYE